MKILSILTSLFLCLCWGNGAIAKAQPSEAGLWSVREIDYGCVLKFSDQANGRMFSYQQDSDGKFVIGYNYPDISRDDIEPQKAWDSFRLVFGDRSLPIGGDVNPMTGQEIKEISGIDVDDFLIFQDYEYFEIIDNKYVMRVSTAGVGAIKSEFASCVRHLQHTGTPPRLLDWDLGPVLDRELQAILLEPGSRELVILVDAEGDPVSCRSKPTLTGNKRMETICNEFLDKAKFVPATDRKGDPVNGEFIVFRLD